MVQSDDFGLSLKVAKFIDILLQSGIVPGFHLLKLPQVGHGSFHFCVPGDSLLWAIEWELFDIFRLSFGELKLLQPTDRKWQQGCAFGFLCSENRRPKEDECQKSIGDW
jgi:hypothetical protein